MRIGTRIIAGYVLAVLVFTVVGVIGYRATTKSIEITQLVAHTHLVKEAVTQVRTTLSEAEAAQRAYLVTGDDRYLDQYHAALGRLQARIEEIRELTSDNPGQLRRIDRLQPLIDTRIAKMAEVVDLRKHNAQVSVIAVEIAEGKNLMDDIRRVLTEMDNEENRLLKQRSENADQAARFAGTVAILGGIAVVVLVIALGVAIQRSITRPLTSFMQFVGRVGEGDLTQEVQITATDELGELARHLDQMVAGLKDVAVQTRQATDSLNSASIEILASTQQQASGHSEQAAAIQQTTTTMEEITQSGAQISERAKQVAASAEATSVASHTGLLAVESTSRTMEAIREQAEAVAENVVSLSEKTQAVGEIIATVNDIAEQSHLLALNAAIEAASAGEQGRSFSVIAGEVKNLADQSREATIQVRSILGDIQKGINTSVMLTEEAVKRVETGRQQAGVADRTIRDMIESIQQSVQAFQQIVAGSNQQQIGFAQVMQAVRDIGQASQQSASSTRQLEKAAINLTAMAQQLQRAVERYRIA